VNHHSLWTTTANRLPLILIPRPVPPKKEGAWYPLFAHALNFPEILDNRGLPCYIHTNMTWKRSTIVSIRIAFLVQTMELNFDCAVLRPPEAWYPWHGPLQRPRHGNWPRFDGSVCYEMIPFVMDCKLWSVDSKSGKYSSSHSLVLVIFPITC